MSATRELLPALAGSSLSTIVVFVPFSLLSGVAGAFFKPLAHDHGARPRRLVPHRRLRGAGGDAPGRARSGRPGRARTRASRGAASGPLEPAAWSRLWPLAPAPDRLLAVAGWLLYRAIDTDFLPAMDEGSIILDYRTPPGTSLAETDGMLRQAERVILSLPDVAGYSRRTGTELGFFVTEPNSGDYVIQLKPRGQRRPVDEVIDALRTAIAAVEPAIQTDFGQLLEDDIGDLTGGAPQPIEVKVFGEDQDQLADRRPPHRRRGGGDRRHRGRLRRHHHRRPRARFGDPRASSWRGTA